MSRPNPSIARRLRTIPTLLALGIVLFVTAPIALPVAMLIDAVRRVATGTPFMATRLLLFGLAYVTCEVAGLVALLWVWIASGFGANRTRLRASTFAIQVRWADAVLKAVRAIFGLTINAEGLDSLNGTPFVLLARHASIVDNLLPAQFISKPLGVHLSYVMKSELLVDPCLDVAGNRLPNAFVTRGAGDTDSELAAIRELGRTMASDGAVLIYPEGTRFAPSKMRKAVKRLARRNPELAAIAEVYRSVLPPRPAGTLALMEATAADIVVMAHRGLDGFARVADIWRGAMVDQMVDVLFWRVPRADIPDGRSERVEWLFRLWADIDRWVVDRVPPGAPA